MQSTFTQSYILLLIIVSGISLILAFFAFRQRRVVGAQLVGMIMFSSAWFALTYAFELVSTTVLLRLFWIKAEYLSIVAIIPLLTVFSLRFTGRSLRLTRWLNILLWIEPVLVLAVVWTMPAYPWYYETFSLTASGDEWIWLVTYGPAFWVHVVYSAALFLYCVCILLVKIINSRKMDRTISVSIIAALFLVGIGSVTYIFRIMPLGFDLSPLLIVICGMTISWFVIKSRSLEMDPIAVETVLHSMSDGVILLDRKGIVAQLNPVAEKITGWCLADAKAKPIDQVCPELALELSRQIEDSEIRFELEMGPAGERHFYIVSVSSVRDHQRQVNARILLLTDITAVRQANRQMAESEAELHKARGFLEKIITTAPLRIAIYNLQNNEVEFSNRSQTMGGRTFEEYNQLSQNDLNKLVHPEDHDRRADFFRNLDTLADGEVRTLEYRRLDAMGWAWTRMYYAVFDRQPDGKIVRLLSISDDITYYKNILENLAESETRYRSLFEGLPIGLYRSTTDGKLLDANPALIRMLHYSNRASLMARNVSELYLDPNDRIRQQKQVDQGGEASTYELQLQCWDGEIIWVNDIPQVIEDANGQRTYEGSIEDITSRKNVERELHNSEEKFRNIFNLSPNSVMLVDLAGDILDCNMGTLLLHGFSAKQEVIGKNITSIVALESRGKFIEALQATLEDGGVQAFRLDLMRADGRCFPAELSTNVIPKLSGRPEMMIVSISDISSRDEAEGKLHDAQTLLAQRVSELELRTHQITLLTEMSNMLQVCLQPDEAYGFVGRYAAQLFPKMTGQLMILNKERKMLVSQASWGESGSEPSSYLMEDCWALRSGQAYLAPEGSTSRLCRHFHAAQSFGSLCVPILSEGKIIGVINLLALDPLMAMADAQAGLASATAEQIGLALSNLQLRDNLREQAIRDPLTGLYNRYYLKPCLERILASAEVSQRPLAVIMIDLDHFKAMNTRYGHLNVDVLLGEFGNVMRDFTANDEVALRYGGDEFVLILPDATLIEAGKRAEQFCHRVRNLVVHLGGQSIQNLTLSIGISGWPQHGHTYNDLLKAADAALFRAKEQRDRVVIAD